MASHTKAVNAPAHGTREPGHPESGRQMPGNAQTLDIIVEQPLAL